MEKLLFCLVQKFVAKKYLFQANGSAKSSSELVKLDVYDRNHQKSLSLIEIGTKAKVLFSGNLVLDEKHDLFRKECQLFCAKAVMYLQQNLPFDVAILKYAQFLHSEKRNDPGSTSGISNLALKVTKALERMICKTFHVPQSDSWEQVCEKIRTQWIAYQLEDIPKEFYTKSNDEACKSSRRTNLYWSHALELCDLQPIQETDLQFMRIDHYQRKIGKILSDDGLEKYTQLICLVKCVLSLTHGNGTLERGFSINKYLLEVHGSSTSEKTLESLHFVKNEVCCFGGVKIVQISWELISSVKNAHSKYVADQEMQKELQSK